MSNRFAKPAARGPRTFFIFLGAAIAAFALARRGVTLGRTELILLAEAVALAPGFYEIRNKEHARYALRQKQKEITLQSWGATHAK